MSDSLRATKQGLHLNGWSVRWPVVMFVLAVTANAAVTHFQVQGHHQMLNEPRPIGERLQALGHRIDSVEAVLTWHRNDNHQGKRMPIDGTQR